LNFFKALEALGAKLKIFLGASKLEEQCVRI
jgi:hypothetical protein